MVRKNAAAAAAAAASSTASASTTANSNPPTSAPLPPPVAVLPTAPPSSLSQLKKQRQSTAAGPQSSLELLWSSYIETTPKNLKLVDAFQLYLMLTGIAQFLYCILVTNFPFNAFLGGFSATVGQFVLAASLRSQVNPKNKAIFPTISPERAFADFVFGTLVLHFFVFNYLG